MRTMGRRTPSYFITTKWVFDRAARRREEKAGATINNAREYIQNTAFYEHGMDIDLESLDALRLLDVARNAVADEFDAINAAAKREYYKGCSQIPGRY